MTNTILAISEYTALIEHNFPQVRVQTAHPITRGWDSLVLEVNDELIFRFPMREDVAQRQQQEIRLLPHLVPKLSTPIPGFEYIGCGNSGYPFPFMGYRKLHGIALEDEHISQAQLLALAPALGTFLSELHSFPLAVAQQTGLKEHSPQQWLAEYLERYLDLRQRVFPLLEADLRAFSEQHWESLLADEAFLMFRPVLIHWDLGCEHIFCDPERNLLTGVIDWGDAGIGDCTMDFVGLGHRGGRALIERVLATYQQKIDAGFWRRLAYYQRYEPFSKLLYGAYEGSEGLIRRGKEELRTLIADRQ
jgi:aminoglycoside 2''-phosphotransferase